MSFERGATISVTVAIYPNPSIYGRILQGVGKVNPMSIHNALKQQMTLVLGKTYRSGVPLEEEIKASFRRSGWEVIDITIKQISRWF